MTYDAYGRQVSTSSDYINMELGPEDPDKATSTSDFRRILKGVRSIAHDAVRDEVTGRTLELIGVRTDDLQNGGYGVLILAMPPKNDKSSEEEEIDSIMKSVTRTGRICFSVDTTDETISNASDPDIIYHSQAEYAGIKKSMIRGGVSDFIRINGTKYYCMSSADSDRNRVYYFCTPNDLLFENSVNFAIFCALGYTVVFALLSMYLLFGYTDKMFEEAESREAQLSEAGKKAGGNLGILSYAFQKFREMNPEKKALITLRIILALVLINLFIDYSRRSADTKGVYVLDYIIGGKWERGINLFAITIKVDVTYPLTEVETILTETLPRVGEQHKEIISGPYYNRFRRKPTVLTVG